MKGSRKNEGKDIKKLTIRFTTTELAFLNSIKKESETIQDVIHSLILSKDASSKWRNAVISTSVASLHELGDAAKLLSLSGLDERLQDIAKSLLDVR